MHDPRQILATHWPTIAGAVIDVLPVASGLSGKPVYRVVTSAGDFALKPIGLDVRGYRFLDRTAQSGLVSTPRVVRPEGEAAKSDAAASRVGWHLLTWLPGDVIGEQEWTTSLSEQAGIALAKLHSATAVLDRQISRNVNTRIHLLDCLVNVYDRGMWFERYQAESLRLTLPIIPAETLFGFAKRVLDQLEARRAQPLPAQLIWGDAWRNNFLFSAGRVSGLIDFATVVEDTPLQDLARLTGSLPTPRDREAALASYSAERPLALDDLQLVRLLDASGTLVAYDRWLVLDKPGRHERLQHLAARLRDLTARPPLGWEAGEANFR